MTNEELVRSLVKEGYLTTPILIEAFKVIDRGDFVPEEAKENAYLNIALPIGYGQTISQPLTVAFMLELLQPSYGEEILEIGSGSGWKTALLAYVVGREEKESFPKKETGRVVSIERIPELKEVAKTNLSKYNFIEKNLVRVILGDGSRGASAKLLPTGGFDKIIAGAAGEKIPLAWKNQVKIGGKIIAPVKNSILALEKTSKDNFEIKEFFGFSFVPLVSSN